MQPVMLPEDEARAMRMGRDATQRAPGHEARFHRYPPWSGFLEREFAWVTFVGSKVRHTFAPEYVDPGQGRWIRASYPALDEEYFEWLDLVQALEAARGTFVMVELGAGYGRWVVNAASFARRFRPDLRLRLVAVEAERTHFSWLRQHIRDNDLDGAPFVLFNAAVGTADGFGWFDMSAPGRTYGNRLEPAPASMASCRRALPRAVARLLVRGRPGPGFERVEVLALDSILEGLARVDLVDLDIQGTELEVLSASTLLHERVARLHIATHATCVEEGLRALLGDRGWRCLRAFPLQSVGQTEWGPVRFGDGVQSWLNPGLARADEPEDAARLES